MTSRRWVRTSHLRSSPLARSLSIAVVAIYSVLGIELAQAFVQVSSSAPPAPALLVSRQVQIAPASSDLASATSQTAPGSSLPG